MMLTRTSMANSFVIASLLLVTFHAVPLSGASPTAPAFVWSNHKSIGLHMKGEVDYRVLSPQVFVNTLTQKFGWSRLLCNSDVGESEKLEAMVAFIGNKFHSEAIAHDADLENSPVLRILKDHFMSSSFSLALPYIADSSEGGGIFSMLFSAIKESCDLETRPGKTIVMGSCLRGTFDLQSPIMSDGVEVVDTVGDVKDFILKQKESRQDHETDIIFACPMSNDGLEKGESEADLLASVLSSLHGSGTSAAFLYASDPFHGTQSHGRLLASNSTSTCDEICETVAGTYEGVIVAITLLIILISGLCCMMGIDTPSRFERASDQ